MRMFKPKKEKEEAVVSREIALKAIKFAIEWALKSKDLLEETAIEYGPLDFHGTAKDILSKEEKKNG
jgi:hypothetical protein